MAGHKSFRLTRTHEKTEEEDKNFKELMKAVGELGYAMTLLFLIVPVLVLLLLFMLLVAGSL